MELEAKEINKKRCWWIASPENTGIKVMTTSLWPKECFISQWIKMHMVNRQLSIHLGMAQQQTRKSTSDLILDMLSSLVTLILTLQVESQRASNNKCHRVKLIKKEIGRTTHKLLHMISRKIKTTTLRLFHQLVKP